MQMPTVEVVVFGFQADRRKALWSECAKLYQDGVGFVYVS